MAIENVREGARKYYLTEEEIKKSMPCGNPDRRTYAMWDAATEMVSERVGKADLIELVTALLHQLELNRDMLHAARQLAGIHTGIPVPPELEATDHRTLTDRDYELVEPANPGISDVDSRVARDVRLFVVQVMRELDKTDPSVIQEVLENNVFNTCTSYSTRMAQYVQSHPGVFNLIVRADRPYREALNRMVEAGDLLITDIADLPPRLIKAAADYRH